METIEEAKNDCILDCGCLNYRESDYTAGYAGGIDYGFEAGVEFAQRWISVEDEFPEVKNHGFSDLVLTKNSYDNIMLERYDSESKKFNGIRYDCIKNNDGQVTHWRPIELK